MFFMAGVLLFNVEKSFFFSLMIPNWEIAFQDVDYPCGAH